MWKIKANGHNHICADALVAKLNDVAVSNDEKAQAFSELSLKQVVLEAANGFDMRSHVRAISEQAIGRMQALLLKGHPLLVSISWGKDSTVCLVLLLEAMRRIQDAGMTLPKCYAINSNTELENPALEDYFEWMQNNLTVFASSNNLPLEFLQATPPITSSFFYTTIGRGKLPRYPGMKRDCSVDWKINPIIKVKKSLPVTDMTKISVVGTRINESEERKKRMSERGDNAIDILTNDDGDEYITPIADWELEDVWGLLAYCDQRTERTLYRTFVNNFDECIEIYKDANAGECVAALGDKDLNGAACGARFGCWNCVASGEQDKSMQSMIASNPDKYGHLAPVAKLRDWIYSLRFDLKRRTWLGRSYDKETKYIVLHPDYLDFYTRRDLLRYMLTIQAEENEWANEHNEEIVRFNLFKFKHIIAIDFMWSMYCDAPHAFSALHEYYQIMYLGRRYPLPEVIYQPAKTSVPPKRWFKLPEGSVVPWTGIAGLNDPYEIHIGKKIRGNAEPTYIKDRTTGEQKEIIPFDVAPAMEVDIIEACTMISRYCETKMAIETTGSTAIEGAMYYLNMGIIKLGRAQASGLDEMLQKAQFWSQLRDKLNLLNVEKYALDNSISDEEHTALKQHSRNVIPIKMVEELVDSKIKPVAADVSKSHAAKGAYVTHKIRTEKTALKIQAAIAQIKRKGEPITRTAVAQIVGISREQISRRYNHCF